MLVAVNKPIVVYTCVMTIGIPYDVTTGQQQWSLLTCKRVAGVKHTLPCCCITSSQFVEWNKKMSYILNLEIFVRNDLSV